MKASRNRTMDLSEDEKKIFLEQCTKPENLKHLSHLENLIVCGDMLETCIDIPENFVDLLIVDPPYNLTKKFGERTFHEMEEEEYEFFTEQWICALKHTLKKTASIYVCCDWKSSLIIGKSIGKHFHIKNRITWQREKGRGAKTNWKNTMEDIWFATVSEQNYTFHVDKVKIRRKVLAPYKENGVPKDWVEGLEGNFRDTFPGNFWDDISIPYWSMPENTKHPTQKPEKLLAKLILASSNEGEMVLDPFLGSGTTAVVAKKLGRNFFGIEAEEYYCGLAQKRLERAEVDFGIQGYSNGIFWERNSLAYQKKAEKLGRKKD